MATVTLNSNEPSAQALADIGNRAFAFLTALGTQLTIRTVMETHGYTQEDHLEGWRLVLKASGSDVTLGRIEGAAAAALRELDAWDEVGFHKAHAALRRTFSEQADFVFADLAPTQGQAAVLGIVKFLDRLDALEKGRTPETQHADKKAIEALATRGIGVDERAHLRAVVALTQTAPGTSSQIQDIQTTRTQDRIALYAWYAQWTEVARAVVDQRGALIQLGIARRRKTRSTTPEVPVTTPVAPVLTPVVNGSSAVSPSASSVAPVTSLEASVRTA